MMVGFLPRETLNRWGLGECQRWMPFRGPRGAFRVGQLIPTYKDNCSWGLAGRKLELAAMGALFPPRSLILSFQFVCVESLVTALVDMYPRVFRKKNRREILILIVSVISFFIGLIMLTEVRA